MTYKEFCTKFKKIRKEKEITIEKMAEDLNESQSRILRVENGKTEMLVSEFLRWCEYFEVSPCSFFDNTYPFKTLRHKRIFEKIKNLDGADFEVIRSIVNTMYLSKK